MVSGRRRPPDGGEQRVRLRASRLLSLSAAGASDAPLCRGHAAPRARLCVRLHDHLARKQPRDARRGVGVLRQGVSGAVHRHPGGCRPCDRGAPRALPRLFPDAGGAQGLSRALLRVSGARRLLRPRRAVQPLLFGKDGALRPGGDRLPLRALLFLLLHRRFPPRGEGLSSAAFPAPRLRHHAGDGAPLLPSRRGDARGGGQGQAHDGLGHVQQHRLHYRDVHPRELLLCIDAQKRLAVYAFRLPDARGRRAHAEPRLHPLRRHRLSGELCLCHRQEPRARTALSPHRGGRAHPVGNDRRCGVL